ncbi:ribonuclease Z, mitochondrial-like isoform X2 [Panonychus citri]|uniref:ribonuclease Z, mitochondrial-like isoform X2 n=1 Tax=Panonychus citri TaxID=50023 RepID=UPI002307D6EE|nr:ribonuclease Z, mitochondrial-like isoform X2 [Panonychus citri]
MFFLTRINLVNCINVSYGQKLTSRFHLSGSVKFCSTIGKKSSINNLLSKMAKGNGSLPNPRCVMLVTEFNKYLFNCGEGAQRAAVTHKTRLTGLNNIFVTHSSWENIAGLPGMCLTLNTAVTAHGPLLQEKLAGITRTFDERNEIKFRVNNDCSSGFKDNFLTIDFIPIYRGHISGDEGVTLKKSKHHLDCAFVYICRLHERPGKLLIAKCIELKIPPGPILGRLKSGEDVTLEDGRIIKSQDVIEPSQPGSTFVILECPSMEYFNSILESEKLSSLHEPDSRHPLEYIFHFSPVNVIKDDKFKEWMRKFPPNVSHIALNELNPSLCFFGANVISHKLRMFDDKIFTTPFTETQANPDLDELNMIPVSVGTQFRIHPITDQVISHDEVDLMLKTIKPEVIEEDIEDRETLIKTIDDYKQHISLVCNNQPDNGPAIIFLGTGSAVPGKYRTSSSIIIETHPDNLIMFDCGEGTFGQFYRFYGSEFKEKLTNLRAIFISHYHADHQLGLVRLLQERAKLTDSRPLVICPPRIERFLRDFPEISGKVDHLCHIALCQTYLKGMSNQQLLENLRLKDLTIARVIHCRDSFGIIITTKGNGADVPDRKIVYSGDAMPSPELIEPGRDCDLLIHEATFDDELIEEAIFKKHSTFSQAVDMGQEMNAGFTLLTHFSQRYYKAPVLPDSLTGNFGVSFDNMKVQFSDFSRLPGMRPVLKVLFADNCADHKTFLQNRKLSDARLEISQSLIDSARAAAMNSVKVKFKQNR